MIEVKETRRRAASLTFCRRHSLAQTDRGPDRAFLRTLQNFDRDLELYWHPMQKRWVLYRVTRKGVVPSEDWVLKEWDIPFGREPGPWLIEQLRKWDKTRGGSMDPKRGDKLYIQSHDKHEERREEKLERELQEMSRDCCNDVEKYAIRNKFTRSLK